MSLFGRSWMDRLAWAGLGWVCGFRQRVGGIVPRYPNQGEFQVSPVYYWDFIRLRLFFSLLIEGEGDR